MSEYDSVKEDKSGEVQLYGVIILKIAVSTQSLWERTDLNLVIKALDI